MMDKPWIYLHLFLSHDSFSTQGFVLQSMNEQYT